MGLVQSNSGVFNGTTIPVTLGATSSASNRVVIGISGNTTVTTLAGWTLQSSSVVSAGIYWFDAAVAASSWTFSCTSGQGAWFVAEVAGGSFITGSASPGQTTSNATTYTSGTTTPTAGTREEFVLFCSLQTTNTSANSLLSVTGGFAVLSDLQVASGVGADRPQGALTKIDDVAANGSTAYSSTGTWTTTASTRGAIIISYATTAASATPRPGLPNRRFWRAAHRSANI